MSLKGDRRDHRAGEVALAVVEQLARHEQAILRIEGGFGIDLFECGDGRRRDRFARFAEGTIIAARRARIEFVEVARLDKIGPRLEIGRASCRESVCQYVSS